MDITTRQEGDALIVSVGDTRIDAAVAIEFKETVRHLAEGAGSPVILDLSNVGFLDSSGLGSVVAVMKLLAPERRLELAALTVPVAKVFRLTRMDSVFTIHDTVPGAIRAAG